MQRPWGHGPSLNPGRGLQEHRRSRSPGATPPRRSPENIGLPHQRSSWVQNRSIRVEPPNDALLPHGNLPRTFGVLEAYRMEKAASLRGYRSDAPQAGSEAVTSPIRFMQNKLGDSPREISSQDENDPIIQGIRRMVSRRDPQPALQLQSYPNSPFDSSSSLYDEIMSTVAMHEVAMAGEPHVTEQTDPESDYVRSNDHRKVRAPPCRKKPSGGNSSLVGLRSRSTSQTDSKMTSKAIKASGEVWSPSHTATTDDLKRGTTQKHPSPHLYAPHRQRRNNSVVPPDRSETRNPARAKATSPPEFERRSVSFSTKYKMISSGENSTFADSGRSDVFYDPPENVSTPKKGEHRSSGFLGRASQDSEPLSDKLRRSLSLLSSRKTSDSGGKENHAPSTSDAKTPTRKERRFPGLFSGTKTSEADSASTKTIKSSKSKEHSFTGRIGKFRFAASLSMGAPLGTHQEVSPTGAGDGYPTVDKANSVSEVRDLQSPKAPSKDITNEKYDARRDFLVEIAEWMTDEQLGFAKSCFNTMPEEGVREMVRRWGPSKVKKTRNKKGVEQVVPKEPFDTDRKSELRNDWEPDIEEMGDGASGHDAEKSRVVASETATIGSKLIDTYPEEKTGDGPVPTPEANMRAPAEGLRLRIQKAATLPGLPQHSGTRTQHKHFWGRDPETGMLRTMKQWWHTVEHPHRGNDTYTINSDFSVSVEKLDPDFRYCCGIDGCEAKFMDPDVLLDHRGKDHAYCYCGPCKLDCGDFGGLVAHKIGSDAHISCWVCGLDFNSTAGRDRHCKAHHPHRKDVRCPGCFLSFQSVSTMIEHIEDGKCSAITRKLLLKLRSQATLKATCPEDPEMNDFDRRAKIIAASFGTIENWQKLDEDYYEYHADPDATENSLGSHCEFLYRMTMPAKQLPDRLRNMVQIAPETGTVWAKGSQYLSDGQATEQRRMVRFMWGGSPLLRVPDDFSTGCNAVSHHNPWLADFCGSAFEKETGYLMCPWGGCKLQFASGNELQSHMQEFCHSIWTALCPECHIPFPKVSRLVAHMEAGGDRCKIMRRHWFPLVMEVACAGLVTFNPKRDERGMFIEQVPQYLTKSDATSASNPAPLALTGGVGAPLAFGEMVAMRERLRLEQRTRAEVWRENLGW